MENNISLLKFSLGSISESLPFFYAELAIAFFFVAIIFTDLFLKPEQKKVLFYIALFGMIVVGAFTVWSPSAKTTLFFDTLQNSGTIKFFKLYCLAGIFLVMVYLATQRFNSPDYSKKSEFLAFLFALLLGLNVMIMANNLLMMYIGIELVSIVLYILVSIEGTPKSTESGLKYLLFGATTSALMLYGISWYYGLTGSLQFMALPQPNSTITAFILFLLSAGALFKLSLFPFHIWAPDVYQGSPTPVTAILAVAPKAAGLVVIAVVLQHLAPSLITGGNIDNDWMLKGFVLLIGLSITIGNFSALRQDNFKRMLAYSSIAHAGFLALSILNFGIVLNEVVLIYLTVYLFMNIGAFLLADYLVAITGKEDIRDYAGMGFKFPYLGILITFLMLSLAGLPPTAGFHAKFLVFAQLYESYQQYSSTWLLVIMIFGVINTVISLFYYLKLPYYLFFKNNQISILSEGRQAFYYLFTLLMLPLIILFFMPHLLVNFINFITK